MVVVVRVLRCLPTIGWCRAVANIPYANTKRTSVAHGQGAACGQQANVPFLPARVGPHVLDRGAALVRPTRVRVNARACVRGEARGRHGEERQREGEKEGERQGGSQTDG